MESREPKPNSYGIPDFHELQQPYLNSGEFNVAKVEFFKIEDVDNILRFFTRNRELPSVKRIKSAYYFGTVYDLGAGESDGGFSMAIQNQALNYVAVDIDSNFQSIPKQEDATINVFTEKTDMLSCLRSLEPSVDENENIDNFILAGVDKSIIPDEEYAKNVVVELKRVATPKSTILVVCTDNIEVNGKKMDLNIFKKELTEQGFEVILNIDPFTNFWAKKQELESDSKK